MKPFLYVFGVVCACAIAGISAWQSTADVDLKAAMNREVVEGDLAGAVSLYRQILTNHQGDRKIVTQTLLRLAGCYERLGRPDEARATYERLVRDHPDSAEIVAAARSGIERLWEPAGTGLSDVPIIAGDAANEIWGGVSPDGRYLSLTDSETGNVAIREVTTGRLRLLTTSTGYAEGFAEHSVWSQDARRLAYSWWTGEQMSLRIVDEPTGVSRTLFTDPDVGWLKPIGWSGDGKGILVFLSWRGNADRAFAMISASEGSSRIVRRFERASPGQVVATRDGRFVAYDLPGSEPGERDVHILDVATGQSAPLLAGASDETPLAWYPDGRHLLYASDRTRAPSAWRVRVRDNTIEGDAVLVRGGIGELTPIGLTASGDFFHTIELAGLDVYIASLDPATGKASDVRRLGGARPGIRRGQAAWSRDGERIAFSQTSGPARSLAVYNPSTGLTALYPLPLVNVERPTWFPSGKGLAIEGTDTRNRRGIFALDFATGAYELLAEASVAPAFSPDGRYMFHNRLQRPGTRVLLRRDLHDGSEEVIDTVPGGLQLSFDGTMLARFTRGETGSTISIMPSAGGERRPLVQNMKSLTNEWAFSHDGRHVYFVAGDDVWRVPVDGGPPEPLGITLPSIKHVSVNPDGRTIALTGGSSQPEVRVWRNLAGDIRKTP